MILLGMAIALAILFFSFAFLGDVGFFAIIAIMFGLLISTYIRIRELQKDIILVKNQLGIIDQQAQEEAEFQMVEKLQQDPNSDELREINGEIEAELENYSEAPEEQNIDKTKT